MDRKRKHRDQLRILAGRLNMTVAGLENDVRTPTGGQADGGLSNSPVHLGDLGTDVFSQELGATLLENEAYLRDEVLAALERLDQNTYGRCENCLKVIPDERLDALPYARFCSACASKAGAGRAVNLNEGRPKGWLGTPGHESPDATVIPSIAGARIRSQLDDIHAAGTPGGGSELGGLAGTNTGKGDPNPKELDKAMGSDEGSIEVEGDEAEGASPQAYSGPSGGAVGGTPANKRARGGKSVRRGDGSRNNKKE